MLLVVGKITTLTLSPQSSRCRKRNKLPDCWIYCLSCDTACQARPASHLHVSHSFRSLGTSPWACWNRMGAAKCRAGGGTWRFMCKSVSALQVPVQPQLVLPIMYGTRSLLCPARGCLQLFRAEPVTRSYGTVSGAVSGSSRAWDMNNPACSYRLPKLPAILLHNISGMKKTLRTLI